MKTEPIVTATVDFSDPAAARAPVYDDVYHPRGGAFEQARQVFLAGNGLPERWQGRARFAILETGFGLGNNFLATWAAWRDDPARCERLTFVSIEKHPLAPADLARAHAASPVPALVRQLLGAWPPPSCNLHCLDFEDGRVRLLLALGDVRVWARALVARIDAFYLDGFAPARNAAMWDRGVFAMLARLAAPEATAATWSAARTVRDGLRVAGFAVRAASGSGGKRDITLARYAPHFVAPAPPGRAMPTTPPSRALVIGGGLAGAMTAAALARQGIACTVIERHREPAAEASGNPAGLFHGAVMGHDGPHARLHRAAALRMTTIARAALSRGVPGRADGLLRLEAKQGWPTMRALLEHQALPPSYVQALDAGGASVLAGTRVLHPAWFYPGGGWIDPAALVRDALATPGVAWRGATQVQRIARDGDDWHVFDGDDRVVDTAPMLVLANAVDALALAALPPRWLKRQRGQVSWCERSAAPWRPLMPVASGGYVLPLPDGRLLFGATSHDDDDDPAIRAGDHADNLARVAPWLGDARLPDVDTLAGRVGWRAVTPDRLPLVGAVPALDALRPTRTDAPRLLPRQIGLWLHSGLGSRGLTTAGLGAELLAAWASGAPWPLEADLVDAIDPARWLVRYGVAPM